MPISVKDSYETEGVLTTFGDPSQFDNVPTWSTTVVDRLLDAGAILLGKTNLPPYSRNFQCENDLFGRTNNPWDLSRTPGGSSGGGTAALATGMVPLELGTHFQSIVFH